MAIGHAPSIPEALVAALSALLPDLDSRQSYLGRLIRPASAWIEDSFGHRTLTHSLLAQASIGTIAYLTLPFGYFLAIVAGWLSHSLADMMTPSGVCWFWPNRARCVIPGNARYRMEAMGKGELWFLIIVGLLGVLLMPLAATGKNTTGLIRSAIGDIASARRDYDAHKGEHAFYLEVKGRDNKSYTDVSGKYYVIGPYQENGFLLETNQGMHSLCQSTSCDWYSEHAVLQKGKPESTTTITIERNRLTTDALFQALEELEKSGKVFVIGSVHSSIVSPAPPTVSVSGESVLLNYSTPRVMAGWRSQTLRDVRLTAQIRHAPNTPLPAIELETSPRNAKPSNQLLDKWLM